MTEEEQALALMDEKSRAGYLAAKELRAAQLERERQAERAEFAETSQRYAQYVRGRGSPAVFRLTPSGPDPRLPPVMVYQGSFEYMEAEVADIYQIPEQQARRLAELRELHRNQCAQLDEVPGEHTRRILADLNRQAERGRGVARLDRSGTE